MQFLLSIELEHLFNTGINLIPTLSITAENENSRIFSGGFHIFISPFPLIKGMHSLSADDVCVDVNGKMDVNLGVFGMFDVEIIDFSDKGTMHTLNIADVSFILLFFFSLTSYQASSFNLSSSLGTADNLE